MIRLGLRLTLSGGTEAVARLALIAVAVALGAGLLLISLAGINAVNTQNLRNAWFNTGAAATPSAGVQDTARPNGSDPLWWLANGDYFGGQPIGSVDVAATGPTSPVPPGIPHLPGPGQYYASPALAALLRSTPRDELGDRFPGRLIGRVGRAALPSPGTLVAIVGRRPAQLAHVPGAVRVTSIFATPPSGCYGSICDIGVGIDARGIDLILSVVACGLLFPILIFTATATRLAAARREQRFAAMRLAGATARQISVIAAVEATLAATVGTAAGFGLFFLLRSPVAGLPITGAPFFPGDLSLTAADVAVVAAGIPAASAVVSWLALRRVRISPLGVTRRAVPPAPRAWRLIPLLAGVAELSWFAVAGSPASTGAQTRAYVPGFVLIMAGLVVAGPWLTMTGARLLARRAHRPAALIAARRLAGSPRLGFRAVSGLVLALFVTTVAVAVITSWTAHHDGSGLREVNEAVLVDGLSGSGARVPPPPATTLARLAAVPGVEGVLVQYTEPHGVTVPAALAGLPASDGRIPASLVSCAELAGFIPRWHCPSGTQVVALPELRNLPVLAGRSRPIPEPMSAQRLAGLGVQEVAVRTNGSVAAIERARTLLEAAYPYQGQPLTPSEIDAASVQQTLAYQRLADVLIVASLAIAGCTLAVSVTAGLTDRKRPFSLLRLTGVPLGLLRRVVALESVVPLLFVAAVSMGAGFLAAQLFLHAQLGYSLRPPGAGFYGIVAAGLAASLVVIACTLPLLDRITGPR